MRATLDGVVTVGPTEEITAREAEILALIARHLTNAQIADVLFISTRTVESHVSAMLRKLQLPDRRSLARHAEAMPGLLVKSGRHDLPAPVTAFIGRTGERAALTEALAEHRLVTATGPGGVGKTRLALSVAAEVAPARREGVWFVDLIHVTDPAMVTATVAETVGVPEQRTASVDRALVASLTHSDSLLVIDNCEHVLDGVRACVERIVSGCPEITVLATSRTRLLLPYERVYVVPGLSVVDGGGDAVDLFAARVAAATGDPTPPDPVRVAAMCRALDGMALAIELAAARFAALGLDGLESGLDQRLRLLTAGPSVADRHGSLRAAIGWSYDLLPPADRRLLRGVAVFASWFDVDAAWAVAESGRERTEIADGLARLAEHSLLVVERGAPTRYRALETIRQYGVERLDQAGELDLIRAGHEWWCRGALAALGQTEAADIDDAWCAAAGAAASRFVGDDALRLFRMAADAAASAGDRAGAARDLATMAMYINRTATGIMATPHSHAEADALLAEARALSDGSPPTQAAIAVAAAFVALPTPGGARRVVELAERAGDGIAHSIALDLLTYANLIDNDIAQAVRTARTRLELLDTLTVSPISGFELGDGLVMAAEVDLAAGDLAGAAVDAERLAGLPFYRDEDHLATCRRLLVDALAGHFDDVVRKGERFRAGWERAGRPVAPNLGRGAYAVATVHGMRGDHDRRAAWVRLTIDLGVPPERLAGHRGWPPVFDGLLALHRNDAAAAVRRLAADIDAPQLWQYIGAGTWQPWYAALWAEAAALDHRDDAAARIERSRHVARDNPIATAMVERAAAIATGDRDTLVRLAVTFARLGCPYQQVRTARMAAGSRAPGSGQESYVRGRAAVPRLPEAEGQGL